MRLIITGGHLTPALAVVQQLQKRGVTDIHWIGCKYTIWGDRESSAEYKVITQLKLPFYSLQAGKIYRTFNPIKLRTFLGVLFKPFGIYSKSDQTPLFLLADIWRYQ